MAATSDHRSGMGEEVERDAAGRRSLGDKEFRGLAGQRGGGAGGQAQEASVPEAAFVSQVWPEGGGGAGSSPGAASCTKGWPVKRA